ncbi:MULTISPECIES: hypothetical protein [Streptomyces]|uniref:Uncharacterized protein n=2 Tax=root TaxID=1 RepID=F2R677_STRVP|nr:hypothetical protein [Streptomyces venezuelae]YP_010754250.1 hypothetical protein QEH31_gp38 [Streptomyces phage Chymera]AMS01597.1 hypothetical protein SEA_CHYMERA_38 [Streptomyces phage Chymera]APE22015.1 hypothetical protein vnz_13970 [Streptomyces venezuelae]QER99406.1 hypothetical protein DEJ43_14150 [Streptomyces venezuelae ATCC 10712]CCA56128.1 hypothetical protein SVEN_2842 [Streptomyces venezuelae ATCC 10712]
MLTTDRVAEILAGQRSYRTVAQLDRDVRDLLAERAEILAQLTRGKDTAQGGESTPAPHRAEVRFTAYGLVPLIGPVVEDLEPDYYGHVYRQLGGWLPDTWSGEHLRGTEHMEFAHVPGLVMPTDINVQVSTRTSRDGSRYMAIQWRRERPSAVRRPAFPTVDA